MVPVLIFRDHLEYGAVPVHFLFYQFLHVSFGEKIIVARLCVALVTVAEGSWVSLYHLKTAWHVLNSHKFVDVVVEEDLLCCYSKLFLVASYVVYRGFDHF